MKLDMSKWKALSIKNRLKKGFRLTTFVASASGVIAGILMILVSMRYSSALTFYGFSQGDIGKVMVTFSETRSATRALIGYTASDTLSKMSDTHDSKKESFQKYWKELQSSIKTDEEQAIYDDINSKLDSYWSLDDEIGQLGENATDPETQKEAEERAVAELAPAYDDIYQQLVALMDTKVTDGDNLSKRLSLVSYAVFGIVIVIIVSSYFISMKIGDEVAVGISKPLDELKQRLRTFAQGDLEAPFPAVDSQDEIADMVGVAKNMAADLKTIISDSDKLLGKMAEGDYTVSSDMEDKYTGDFIGLLMAMRQMKTQMNDVMSHINEISSLVTAGSNNLAQAAQEIAEGTMDQSAAIEELQATFADITGGVEKTSRSSMIHTGLHRSMLRKQITAIQRCRAWLMLSDASMIHLSRLRISFLRLRILPVRQTFFHSMQLSRQRVQVRQVKDSQLLRDKSEVFQSRVPRLRLTHVSL